MGTVINLYFNSYTLAMEYVRKQTQIDGATHHQGVYPSRLNNENITHWFASYRFARPLLPSEIAAIAKEASNFPCIAFYVSETF